MDAKRLRYVIVATAAVLLAAAGTVVYVVTREPADGPRQLKALGTWKEGELAVMADGPDAGPLLSVVWTSGDRRVQLGGRHRDIPLVVDVPTGDLVIVCGEPGRYNMQIWKGPDGPFTAKHVGTRRDVEEALGKLHPVKSRGNNP